jgi:predicted metal-binding membrane protein
MWLLWGSLTAIVGLAWAYLIQLASNMSAMDMAAVSAMRPWLAIDYLMMFIMWAVMMIGMMVPTALRSVSIYAHIANQAKNTGSPVAATYWFIFGYVLVWTGFSLLAATLQGVLTAFGLLSSMMVASSAYLGAGLLITAGLYQLSPWKDTCLQHCQTPALFLAGRFGPRIADGIKLGIHHGAYCLGCCWLLMALLFVGGVMNLLWIVLITAFVFLEKLLPLQFRLSHVAAVLMIVTGTGFLLFG